MTSYATVFPLEMFFLGLVARAETMCAYCILLSFLLLHLVLSVPKMIVSDLVELDDMDEILYVFWIRSYHDKAIYHCTVCFLYILSNTVCII